MSKTLSLPQIAISSCLTGQAVRYDGGHKHIPWLIDTLKKKFSVLPVCPEMAIGLSVPRNKIQLTYRQGQVSVLDSTNPDIDLTYLLRNYALRFLKQYNLSGLVLQEKSPSCGINNCKLFADDGEIIGYSSGLFATTIMDVQPLLPICCAVDLHEQQVLTNFIKQVQNYN